MTEPLDVKQAVKTALEYVTEVFDAAKLRNLGLEEVEKRGDEWLVTVGFSRPWDYPERPITALAALSQGNDTRPDRDYKVVRLDAKTGEVHSVKNRE